MSLYIFDIDASIMFNDSAVGCRARVFAFTFGLRNFWNLLPLKFSPIYGTKYIIQ